MRQESDRTAASNAAAHTLEALPPISPSTALSAKELQLFKDRLFSTSSPEALFGELAGESVAKLAALNKVYFQLVNRCKVSHYSADKKLLELANSAFSRLSEMYRTAQESIRNETYTNSSDAAKAAADTTAIGVVESKTRVYSLRELIAEGDVALIYRAEFKDSQGVLQQACVKIAKTGDGNNELIENEQKILADLEHVSLPKLLEGFELPDGRAATALDYTSGLNLHQLREIPLYSHGIKQDAEYHIGWILERQLALLGYLHSKGIVHGSVEPAHLIVQGEKHNVVLVDFCWAVKKPTKSDHIKIGQEYYSAPEVFQKSKPHPAMDIYGLGKSAVYILGGDPEYGSLPDSLDPMVAKFIARMVEEDPKIRAADAHQLAYHLVVIRNDCDKAKEFIPLAMQEPSDGQKEEDLKQHKEKIV